MFINANKFEYVRRRYFFLPKHLPKRQIQRVPNLKLWMSQNGMVFFFFNTFTII